MNARCRLFVMNNQSTTLLDLLRSQQGNLGLRAGTIPPKMMWVRVSTGSSALCTSSPLNGRMRTKQKVDGVLLKLVPVLEFVSLCILLQSTASAFVSRSQFPPLRHGSLHGATSATTNDPTTSSSVAATSTVAANDDQPLRPVMVVGDAPAALGVVLALHTLEVLTGRTSLPNPNDNKAKQTNPRQQLVYHFPADAVNELPEFLDDLDDPILHFTVDDGTNEGSTGISADLLTAAGMAAARDKIPFLGLQAITPREKISTSEPETLIPEDVARAYSSRFQQILAGCVSLNNIVVTLDLPLHLAMLNFNCLPQSASSTTQHRNSFHVLKPDGGGVVTDYLYPDDGSVFDPLSCKTQETIITSPPTVASVSISATAGAAYTALRGNGLDALASAAISAAVSTMLADGSADTRTSVDWSTVTSTVQLSKHIREFGVVSMPGEIRIRYRECGYR